MKKILSGLVLAATAYAGSAAAADATLSGASCFPKGTYFSKAVEKFIPAMNEANAGVKINYVGGAPAIGSPFTLVQKASKGVYGLVSCTGAYYQNVLTEVDALKLIEKSSEELRQNGGFALMDKLHREKGLHYLGRIMSYIPFHLYLSKKIDKPDLKGLHLRVAPIYTAFFQAMGATTQRSTIAEVYTYMENGTVVGYGWPVTGILPDWHKVTKYRVDPGFYDADINLVVHLEAWEKMTESQRKAMTDMMIKFEGQAQGLKKEGTDAVADQASKGIEAITFTGADREKWLTTAREAGWASVIKNSPQHGPELKKLFTN